MGDGGSNYVLDLYNLRFSDDLRKIYRKIAASINTKTPSPRMRMVLFFFKQLGDFINFYFSERLAMADFAAVTHFTFEFYHRYFFAFARLNNVRADFFAQSGLSQFNNFSVWPGD